MAYSTRCCANGSPKSLNRRCHTSYSPMREDQRGNLRGGNGVGSLSRRSVYILDRVGGNATRTNGMRDGIERRPCRPAVWRIFPLAKKLIKCESVECNGQFLGLNDYIISAYSRQVIRPSVVCCLQISTEVKQVMTISYGVEVGT